MSKSAFPTDTGFVNPAFDRAKFLITHMSEIREMVSQVQNIARMNGGLGANCNISEVLKQAESAGVKAKLGEWYSRFCSVEDTPPVIGPPPNTKEIYGRFGKGTKITDIGSGNCMKLKRFSGAVDITAVDPELEVPSGVTIKPIKSRIEEVDIDAEDILTSTMALPQMEPQVQEKILQNDGLHLVPDHECLLEIGAAQKIDGRFVVKTPVKDYTDFPVPCDGWEVEPGYRTLAPFRIRTLDFSLGARSVKSPNIPQPDCHPSAYEDLNLEDIGYKWDGKFVELESWGGIVTLTDRAGFERRSDFDPGIEFCLHLEEMKDHYVLLRIVHWRKYIPPHCGNVLRQFAMKVSMTIDGMYVVGPPVYRANNPPSLVWYRFGSEGLVTETIPPGKVDGLISRKRGRDLYCKFQWTVDLRPDRFEVLRGKLSKVGCRMEVDEKKPGMWEYGLVREGAVVRFVALRDRRDKLVETSDDTVLYLLKTPTLGERLVLEHL